MPRSFTRKSTTSSRCATAAGVTKIEVVTALFHHPLPLRAKKASGGSRSATGLRTPTTSGSSQRPGTMPTGPDLVEHLADAVWEPAGRRRPVSDRVPPCLADVRVPPGVDAEVLGSGTGGGGDEGHQPFRGRVAHQGVHVVVKDDGEPAVVCVGPPDGSAVFGEPSHRALEAVGTERDGDRDRLEGFSGFKREPPMVLGVCRTEQGEVGARAAAMVRRNGVATPVLADLPVPGAIVLDLPRPGVSRPAIDGGAHRQVRPGRPAACAS